MQAVLNSNLPTLANLKRSLQGQRVLLRVDFNDGGHAPDSVAYRLQATLPTIHFLIERGARVAILTHRGRPQGRVLPHLSTAPFAEALAALLGKPVSFVPDCLGRVAEQAMNMLQPGQVCMLENTRFHLGEQLNQSAVANQFAALAEVVVNEAFACAHRTQASTSGLAALRPTMLGLQFVKELQWLERWHHAAQPRALLVGGNKPLDKLDLMQHNLRHCQLMLLGGVVGQTFLAAKDVHLRQSQVEFGVLENARDFLAEAGVLGCRVHLPRDFLVARQATPGLLAGTRAAHQLQEGEAAQDLGPLSLATWQKILQATPTVAWLGSVGLWQQLAFREGTTQLARTLLAQAERAGTFSLLGGNGLLQALQAEGLLPELLASGVGVSTGGGALQHALCGHPLPALQALAGHEQP